VRRANRTFTDREWTAVHARHLEEREPPHRTCDVEDRVHCSHLVQVHVVRCHAVDRALRLRDRAERCVGAGTKDPHGRANALRIILAEENARDAVEIDDLVQLATDIDDMTGEQLAAVADVLRGSGALDVVLTPTIMKKGRPGTRVEVLCRPPAADAMERALFVHSSSIGIRRSRVERSALPREERTISVLDHDVRVKVVTLPSGARRTKPEHDDLAVIAAASGRALRDVAAIAHAEAERLLAR
jgi:uncharacterized protein (DUF111 family)